MFTRTLLSVAALTISGVVFAQMTPVGTWNTIDDKTKEIKSEIVVTESAGVISGKISKLLRKDADQKGVCKECTDDRKDKPLIGLEIIRGAKKTDGKDVWEDGKVLDPENGKNYALRLTPVEGGKKFGVRSWALAARKHGCVFSKLLKTRKDCLIFQVGSKKANQRVNISS